jgi:hypothetical protein
MTVFEGLAPQRPDQGEIGGGRHAAPRPSLQSMMMMQPVMVMPMVVHGVMAMGSVMPVMMRPLRGNIGHLSRRTGVNAEDAFNPADHTADDAANHSANRSRLLITHIGAMRDAARNALGLRGHGHEADRGENAKSKHCQFHMVFL